MKYILGVPLRVGLSAASPRYAAGFPLLSLTHRLNLDSFDFPDEQDAKNQGNQINHKNHSADK
jgi:hypothetical protein